jgi:hypothetical protein
MDATTIYEKVVDQGLLFMDDILKGKGPVNDAKARVLIMATWGQESSWTFRLQNGGPARSYGMFERKGGLSNVMGNKTTLNWLTMICNELDIPVSQTVVFEAMAWNDDLAVAMTRFNYYLVPSPIPALGKQDDAYHYYDNRWGPGTKRPQDWPANYQESMIVATGKATV